MRVSSIRLAAAALAIGAAGLAHAGLFDDDEARKRIEDLRASQEKADREITERIGRLEESVRRIGVVELLQQIEGLSSEIARLRGSLEVLANQNEQIQKRQRDFYLDLDSRLKRLESAPAAGAALPVPPPAVSGAAADPGAAGPRPVSKDDQAREIRSYDAASSLFRRNDFASAAEAFRAFLKDFPHSTLAPNATYWIGICQANLKDHRGALATQEELLAKFPQSPKAPDALLAIAAIQAELGDAGSARNTLEDIIARFPASEAAGKARTRLVATRR